ncbi:hypothetical protein Pa4123_41670 [Phytohabitans aurantiacus]|uniref:Secreted protein n=1 Tax=Phytohabitans aurantiacus TaxID=3016789 RepID=A0ABQ5QY86_9ACTN|nr:hypothetical protein Pa4123_41670 [Phytohabitans aurantiacus]
MATRRFLAVSFIVGCLLADLAEPVGPRRGTFYAMVRAARRAEGAGYVGQPVPDRVANDARRSHLGAVPDGDALGGPPLAQLFGSLARCSTVLHGSAPAARDGFFPSLVTSTDVP